MKGLKAKRTAQVQDIKAVAISSDGKHVASASADHTARVWNMSGNEVGKYVAKDVVNDVVFFPDQRHLILSCLDRTVKIVDWRSGSLVETLRGHAANCSRVDVLPVSGKIVSASYDKTVKVWSRQKTVEAISPEHHFGYSLDRNLRGHKVMSENHDRYPMLTISGFCISSERGGKRRLGNQRLRG